MTLLIDPFHLSYSSFELCWSSRQDSRLYCYPWIIIFLDLRWPSFVRIRRQVISCFFTPTRFNFLDSRSSCSKSLLDFPVTCAHAFIHIFALPVSISARSKMQRVRQICSSHNLDLFEQASPVVWLKGRAFAATLPLLWGHNIGEIRREPV